MADFAVELDKLQQHVSDAKSAAQSASTESRDKLKEHLDKAQADMDAAGKDAKQQTDQAASGARRIWAEMKAETAARMGDAKARIEQRARQMDVKATAEEAHLAEAGAADAIDFAMVAVDNARLAILEAISTRINADEKAKAAGA